MSEQLKQSYLICAVDEQYALAAGSVVQIVEYKDVTPVPEVPRYIAGIMNLRGRVIPVVDLRARFRKPPLAEGARRCIVIARFDALELGLAVDSALDLAIIEDDQIAPPPQVGSDYAHVFVKAIGVVNERMVLILDENRIVNHQDLEFLEDTER